MLDDSRSSGEHTHGGLSRGVRGRGAAEDDIFLLSNL